MRDIYWGDQGGFILRWANQIIISRGSVSALLWSAVFLFVDQAAKKIRTLGGTFQISVDKDTTYLVAGGKVGASKLAKTERYGVKVIDEAVFMKIVKEAQALLLNEP